MAKYTVHYIRTYDNWYDVEAESETEAEEKLYEKIASGEFEMPDNLIEEETNVYKAKGVYHASD